jgi:hypothetical protein
MARNRYTILKSFFAVGRQTCCLQCTTVSNCVKKNMETRMPDLSTDLATVGKSRIVVLFTNTSLNFYILVYINFGSQTLLEFADGRQTDQIPVESISITINLLTNVFCRPSANRRYDNSVKMKFKKYMSIYKPFCRSSVKAKAGQQRLT